MEFDKSKVYTALNADDIPIKSRGFVADSIYALKDKILHPDSFIVVSITSILNDIFYFI